MIKESVKQFAKKAMAEAKVDIDIEFCKRNKIKYSDNENDASKVDLFNTKSNKDAFDFIVKLK